QTMSTDSLNPDPTDEPVSDLASSAAEESPAAEDAPTLASSLDIGGSAPVEASEDAAPHFEPTIRGKVDRFGVAWGTGRRKTAVARVRVKDGDGKFTVNGRELKDYFPIERDLGLISAPLRATDMV